MEEEQQAAQAVERGENGGRREGGEMIKGGE